MQIQEAKKSDTVDVLKYGQVHENKRYEWYDHYNYMIIVVILSKTGNKTIIVALSDLLAGLLRRRGRISRSVVSNASRHRHASRELETPRVL